MLQRQSTHLKLIRLDNTVNPITTLKDWRDFQIQTSNHW